jgi:hypothetical protein
MKYFALLTGISSAALLAACGSPVPSCSDEQSIDLVTQIADREMVEQLGEEAEGMFSFILNSIRTTSTNADTGANECAAELAITGPSGTAPIPITYSVEVTDNGEQIYVNVFGL